MNLEKLTDRVTKELEVALSDDISQEKHEEIWDIIHRAMLDASKRTTREMKETAVVTLGHEADLAHKLQEQMDKKRDMLITNLMAMR